MQNNVLLDKYEVKDKQIFDLETGEILSKKESKLVLEMQAKLNHREIAENAVNVDVEIDTRIVKARNGEGFHVLNIKESHEFTKMFKVDVRNMSKTNKLSIYAKAFMHEAMSYLRFPTNTIIYESHNPSIDELCELMDMKRTKIYEVLKELEDKGVIIREKVDKNLIIYINPFLYSCGLVDVETYEKFKNNIFNPFNN